MIIDLDYKITRLIKTATSYPRYTIIFSWLIFIIVNKFINVNTELQELY